MPPSIDLMFAWPDSVFPGDTVHFDGTAKDRDTHELSLDVYYQNHLMDTNIWVAPKIIGEHYLVFVADDGFNTVKDSVLLFVKDTLGSFADLRDNHEYKWVKIGQQIWMAENLAFLPDVKELPTFHEGGPFYYVYAYTGQSVEEAKQYWTYANYGVLYNRAATLASLCPEGWRLPEGQDWNDLFDYVGEPTGVKIKTAEEWGLANESLEISRSGFNARPAGTWQVHGSPGGATWLTSEYQGQRTYLYYDETHYLLITNMSNDVSVVESEVYTGHSVRCIKDGQSQ